MASTFPTSIDNFTNPTATSLLTSPSHSGQHADINDAVEAIETQIGTTAAPVLARLASPTFTGTPAAPTAVVGTNTTQLATTAFVQTASAEVLAEVRDYLGAGSATAIDVFPRFIGVGVSGQTSGVVIATYFTPTQNMTVTQITYVGSTGASSGLTLARFGLYDATTLLARTANDTTIFNTGSTNYTRSFDTAGGYPSSVNLVAGTRYAVAVIQVGTTPGQIQASKSTTQMTTLSPQIVGRTTGQTDLPTSTPTTGGTVPDILFARLS